MNNTRKQYLNEYELRDLLQCERAGCPCKRVDVEGKMIGFTHCPAHLPDNNPSLKVETKEYGSYKDDTFFDCKTGCEYKDVRAGVARERMEQQK